QRRGEVDAHHPSRGRAAAHRRLDPHEGARRRALVAGSPVAPRDRPELPADQRLPRLHRVRELPARRAVARAPPVAHLLRRARRPIGHGPGPPPPPPAPPPRPPPARRTAAHWHGPGAPAHPGLGMGPAPDPDALPLDEPLAGMGAEESRAMVALLKKLRYGHAILLVEHDMDAIFAVADVITVMVDG